MHSSICIMLVSILRVNYSKLIIKNRFHVYLSGCANVQREQEMIVACVYVSHKRKDRQTWLLFLPLLWLLLVLLLLVLVMLQRWQIEITKFQLNRLGLVELRFTVNFPDKMWQRCCECVKQQHNLSTTFSRTKAEFIHYFCSCSRVFFFRFQFFGCCFSAVAAVSSFFLHQCVLPQNFCFWWMCENEHIYTQSHAHNTFSSPSIVNEMKTSLSVWVRSRISYYVSVSLVKRFERFFIGHVIHEVFHHFHLKKFCARFTTYEKLPPT